MPLAVEAERVIGVEPLPGPRRWPDCAGQPPRCGCWPTGCGGAAASSTVDDDDRARSSPSCAAAAAGCRSRWSWRPRSSPRCRWPTCSITCPQVVADGEDRLRGIARQQLRAARRGRGDGVPAVRRARRPGGAAAGAGRGGRRPDRAGPGRPDPARADRARAADGRPLRPALALPAGRRPAPAAPASCWRRRARSGPALDRLAGAVGRCCPAEPSAPPEPYLDAVGEVLGSVRSLLGAALDGRLDRGQRAWSCASGCTATGRRPTWPRAGSGCPGCSPARPRAPWTGARHLRARLPRATGRATPPRRCSELQAAVDHAGGPARRLRRAGADLPGRAGR